MKTVVYSDKKISDYLFLNESSNQSKTAFILLDAGQNDCEVSYCQLADRVRIMALRLSALSGQRMMLMYQETMDFIVAFLACCHAGVIAVPVPFGKNDRHMLGLKNIMMDSQASGVLCSTNSSALLKKKLQVFSECRTLNIYLTDVEDAAIGDQSSVSSCTQSDIAFLQYTSGSTDKPKGVIISHSNILCNQYEIEKAFGSTSESIILSWLPFHHDMGLIGNILHSIYLGSTCILMSPLQFIQMPQRWLEGISKYKVTHSGGPNFAYDLCVERISPEDAKRFDLTSWKVAYNGSEVVKKETMHKFSEHFRSSGFEIDRFYPCYGLAEATLLVSGKKLGVDVSSLMLNKVPGADNNVELLEGSDREAITAVSCGKVVEGIEVKVISPYSGEDCPDVQEGEICISGRSVSRGYWNSSRECFYHRDGAAFFRTGDLGFIYHGELYVHGRLKDIFVVNGKNVYPTDLERIVGESEKVVETNGIVVFSLGKEEGRFIAVVEIKRGCTTTLDVRGLIASIDKRIQGFLGIAPYDIVLTSPLSIPRTTSGKLQRFRCLDLYENNGFPVLGSKRQLSHGSLPQARKMELLEQVMQQATTETIRLYVIDIVESKVGALHSEAMSDMELIEFGLDSLRVVEVLNAINKELGISLDLSMVSGNNTLVELVQHIEGVLWLSKKPLGNELVL